MAEVEYYAGKFNFCIHSEAVLLHLRCEIIQHMFHDETKSVNLFSKKCADVE
jgi:hypothetical protein